MNNEIKYSGNDIMTTLLIVFIVLKLTGTISWSWWWVLSPIWIPFITLVFIAIVMVLVGNDDIRK